MQDKIGKKKLASYAVCRRGNIFKLKKSAILEIRPVEKEKLNSPS